MDAIVTAGGRIKGAFAQQEGVEVKALLAIDGKTLLERTVGALRGSRRVERLCVVGPRQVEGLARQAGADLFVEERTTGIDNLLRGVEALGATGKVLCSASDLPFVRAEDVDDLVERTPVEAALSYSVFTREEWEAAFPDAPATFIPLSDGDFTGSCIQMHDAAALIAIEPVLQRVFAARKSPAGMARLLGLGLMLRLVCGRLLHASLGPSSEDARRRVEMLVGMPCAVVRGCSPRIGADVDHAQDWEYARQYAQRRTAC